VGRQPHPGSRTANRVRLKPVASQTLGWAVWSADRVAPGLTPKHGTAHKWCPFTGPVELGRCAGFDLGGPRRRVGLILGL